MALRGVLALARPLRVPSAVQSRALGGLVSFTGASALRLAVKYTLTPVRLNRHQKMKRAVGNCGPISSRAHVLVIGSRSYEIGTEIQTAFLHTQ